jgi:hypothetical protein
LSRTFLLHASLISLNVYSQPFHEAFHLSHVGSSGSMNPAHERYEEHFNHFYVSIPLRIDSNFLVLTASYDFYVFHYPGIMYRLKMTRFSTAWFQQFGKSWSATLALIPRLATAGDWVVGDNLQLGFAFLVRKRYSPRLRLSTGLYYNSEFFGPFFVPLAGIHWKISRRLQLYGILPTGISFDYAWSPAWHAGLSFSSLTNSFRLNDGSYLRTEENQLRFFLTYYLLERHAFSIEAGRSVLRNRIAGMRTTDFTHDLEVKDGWLLKLGYGLRIPLNE